MNTPDTKWWNAYNWVRRRINPSLRKRLGLELCGICTDGGEFIGVGIRWQQ